MKADNLSFLEFIGPGKRTFCIPVYQRNYDWKRMQCITLFKDIETIAVDKNRDSHFLGTIVYVEGDSTPNFRQFIVIDGQQRLTSIMILLKAILDCAENEELKLEIKESYLTNRFSPESLRIKLKPMKSDACNFQKLINNQIQDMEESQILLNYNLFRDLIKESDISPEEIYQGIQKLEIVYIQLAKEKENPQLIFESLNSTGLDLTQADLIRNYLLMGQAYEQQEKLYNNYWTKLEKMLPDAMISDFIRDYLTLKTGVIPKKDYVYNSFKDYYQSLDNYDAEGFLDELTTYGEYYSWFKYCNSPSEEVNWRLSQLQRLKSTTVYPFLLNIFEDCYMYRNIDVQMMCKTLDVILSYVMRRLLCEMPTNALNKVFASMSKDIERYDDKELCEKVALVLAGKKGKVIFPDDELLKDKVLLRNSYKFPHIKYVLEQVERRQGKEVVAFDELTIEHIMPQTLTAKWKIDLGKKATEIYEKYVHCIGNLTLTGYNSEMSNDSFEEKKKVYKESNIYISKQISNVDTWGEAEINKRSEWLIKEICSIWQCPDVINLNQTDTDTRTEFDIMDEVDVTGRTPCEVEICGGIIPVDSWRSFLKNICMQMYEYDAQIFRSLIRHKDFKGRSKRIISDTDENMRVPQKIAEGIYLEMNLSANEALNYAKLVIDKYEGMENECSYRLKPLR